MVLLGVNSESELLNWKSTLNGKSEIFFEPDVNAYTALAIVSDGVEFKSLRLL
jgi:hypothetical protein